MRTLRGSCQIGAQVTTDDEAERRSITQPGGSEGAEPSEMAGVAHAEMRGSVEPPPHEEQVEHYLSSQLYDTFQAMHRPRVQSRPLTAGTSYLRECEAQQVAPLPMFDRLLQDRAITSKGVTTEGLARLDLRKYGIGDKSAIALATFLRTAAGKLSLSELSVAHNAIKDRGLHALVKSLAFHPQVSCGAPQSSS